jgi:ubiquinone/menaquinone biosynthesis C-methylase UbiE
MAEKAFQPGSFNYDDGIATNYPAARAFSPETAATWTAILAPFVARSCPSTVLDLGCGTGRFSALFAARFQARVIGLDPAFAMLRAASQGSSGANLFYAAARSESLPLSDASCHLAWLSQFIHHIADREACAHELRRVVRPGGHVVIRGVFGDRLDGFPDLIRFFPGTRSIMTQFPTLDQVRAAFCSAGFMFERLETVPQKTCDTLVEFAARTLLRADSTLVLLPDAEFERCQAALERAAISEMSPSPVIERLDLMVLSAPDE